jgi:hypothetical protein
MQHGKNEQSRVTISAPEVDGDSSIPHSGSLFTREVMIEAWRSVGGPGTKWKANSLSQAPSLESS